MPFAGAFFTDPEDSNEFEQTSIGAITRYACTYMTLRKLLQLATEGTDYNVDNLLI